MPSFRTYPRSMRNLPANVRAKALDIANQLVDEGEARDSAARIAIGRAKRWASRPKRSGHKRRAGKPPAKGRVRRVPQRGRAEVRIAKASHGTTGGTG